MQGHFAAWYDGDNQIGGCLQWNEKDDTFHMSKWFMFKPMETFTVKFYQSEDGDVTKVKECKVKLNCTHRINPGQWSRGSITLERSKQ